MDPNFFQESVRRFTHDFASGDAVRHLARKGFSVKEISGTIDFPLPVSEIQKIVWQCYLDEKIICLEQPIAEDTATTEMIIKEYGEYGRVSYRKVTVDKGDSVNPNNYIACNYGILKKANPEKYDEFLQQLSESDRDYIKGLPWPEQIVWHIRNERMKHIFQHS